MTNPAKLLRTDLQLAAWTRDHAAVLLSAVLLSAVLATGDRELTLGLMLALGITRADIEASLCTRVGGAES